MTLLFGLFRLRMQAIRALLFIAGITTPTSPIRSSRHTAACFDITYRRNHRRLQPAGRLHNRSKPRIRIRGPHPRELPTPNNNDARHGLCKDELDPENRPTK